MNWSELLIIFLVNLVAMTAAILIVLWIERQRHSSLTFSIGKPRQIEDSDPLKRPPVKWLTVNVHNRDVPNWLARVYRGEPALNCRVWVSFHNLDGQKVFEKDMAARWDDTEQPEVEIIIIEEDQVKKELRRLTGVQDTYDISPGGSTTITVANRFENEEACFGWNNESYLHEWCHPDWSLGKDMYLVKIRVKTGGWEYWDAFMLLNNVPYQDFRLVTAAEEYKRKLIA